MAKDPDFPEPDEDDPTAESDEDAETRRRQGLLDEQEQDPAREAQNVRSTGTTTPGGGPSTTRPTSPPRP